MVEKLDFITPTFMKVLQLFLDDPMGEYHEREAMRRTHVSKGSANKILRLLAELQFLERNRKGRMIFYKLNVRDPTVKQFKTLANIYGLKKLVDSLKEHSRRIILFGSSAEGIDVKASDLDLFVLASERSYVKSRISEFNKKSERKVAPIILDANEFVKLKRGDRPLHENIESGITLWVSE